jgi:chorismate synthase
MARYHGHQDPRGSGHFSGRITAGLTFAGAVCTQIIRTRGIRTAAHVLEIDGIGDRPFDAVRPDLAVLDQLREKIFPVLDESAGQAMIDAVLAAQQDGDSVGGIVETMIIGLPAGLGDPMFDGLESRLASLLFGIPAVKGLEFGIGFAAARMRGSLHNDVPVVRDRSIRFLTNHSGGIQGGISNGMPVLFRAVIRPPASIAREQQTINLEQMAEDRLAVAGRHDPCIVPRVIPVIEAAAALFALDVLMDAGFGRMD